MWNEMGLTPCHGLTNSHCTSIVRTTIGLMSGWWRLPAPGSEGQGLALLSVSYKLACTFSYSLAILLMLTTSAYCIRVLHCWNCEPSDNQSLNHGSCFKSANKNYVTVNEWQSGAPVSNIMVGGSTGHGPLRPASAVASAATSISDATLDTTADAHQTFTVSTCLISDSHCLIQSYRRCVFVTWHASQLRVEWSLFS